MGEGPVYSTFYTTGNNIDATPELLRRIHPVYYNAQMDRPYERTGIKHPDLRSYLLRERANLAWMCHVYVQNWIAQGCPLHRDRVMGSFEDWSAVMGGIIAATGLYDMDNWMVLHKRYSQVKGKADFDPNALMQWIAENFEMDECFSARSFRHAMWYDRNNPNPSAQEALQIAPKVEGCYLKLGRNQNLDDASRVFLNGFAKQTFNLDDGRTVSLIRDGGRFRLKVVGEHNPG
jgi:hypothetical protein